MKHNDAVIRQYCRAVGKQLPLPAAQRRQLLAGLREEFTESAPGLHHAGRTDCPRRNTGRSCTGAFKRYRTGACADLSEKAASAVSSGRCADRPGRLLRSADLCAGAHGQLCSIRGGAYHHPAHDRSVRSRTIASGGHQTFVPPFSLNIRTRAHRSDVRRVPLLPEYPYRFAAAAAPVVQTAGSGCLLRGAASGQADWRRVDRASPRRAASMTVYRFPEMNGSGMNSGNIPA